MTDKEQIRFTEDGLVECVREVVTRTVTLSQFFEKIKLESPQRFRSPILPRGNIAYFLNSEESPSHELVTMFFPSEIRTICYRRQRDAGDEGAIRNYNIAFPHMVIRFDFHGRNLVNMYVGVMKEIPEHYQQPVYKMRMPNLWDNGKVCIPLEPSPGDLVASCEKNIDLFFHRSPFSDDLRQWPPGINSFADWERLTTNDARFILDIEWDFMMSLGDFVEGRSNDVRRRR